MKKNQESMFVEEQATRQEREENVEGQQSRMEETQPLPSEGNAEMGEMWKEIRMLRQQVGSRTPTPKRRSPFSLAILEEGLPPSFRQPNIGEYDGHIDPEEHLGRFENATLLHQYTYGVKCLVFLGTLVSSKRHQKNYLSLFVIKQQEAETLREFVQPFNNAAVEIPAATPDIMISAFTQGLRGGEFFKSLVKKPPSSYDDLLARAEKYVNFEDAQPNRDKVMEVREPEGRWEKSQRAEGGVRMPPVDRREGSSSGDRPKPHPSLRRSRGPPWINRRVGEPRREKRGQDAPQEPVEPRRRAEENNHSTRGMIHMISGGATDGDSGRARKVHGRMLENFEISRGADLPQDPVISFGPEDLRGIVAPHNDALVVTATIANYDVARIFIDNGSSVNILFKSTLDQMNVERFEFDPVSTPLYGFASHAIPPLGQITLPLSLGRDSRRVTKMITFTVVDTPSSYNGILGRPALRISKP
ncbi:uncharacterized protein LOC142544263 [Primulina tabacum]|uniref:uncharacterized protein LOC142544263 n=1 Tax=Primulina tabacum TaxID=48773 RepID=UPI003F59BE8A